ncbi:hypothetical protein HPB48_024562 [Haemaphysalis longicornis]|uniref:WW domain-containing protein n=1 Tax=Haemaphysalis longicornis TaxID=44386 RepID=A0A9J6H6T6_HAELO|nr:hypothetical protein HPB48_024562 [Haemaphysalis longicornis]
MLLLLARRRGALTYFGTPSRGHLTQTTTWDDPRKKSPSAKHHATPPPPPHTAAPAVGPFKNLGPLPDGWEQATTAEGEVYFINHIERTTSWFDPRILDNQSMTEYSCEVPNLNLFLYFLPSQMQLLMLRSLFCRATSALFLFTHKARVVRDTGFRSAKIALKALLVVVGLGSAGSAVSGGGTGPTSPPDPMNSISAVVAATSSLTIQQQRQQKLRLQQLQMERERLKIRQQEILRQTAFLGNSTRNVSECATLARMFIVLFGCASDTMATPVLLTAPAVGVPVHADLKCFK